MHSLAAAVAALSEPGAAARTVAQDYLAAPMPYLVGLPAQCLPALRGMALEETVLVDLDSPGSTTPPLGGPADDARLLPHADRLEAAFEVGGWKGWQGPAGRPGGPLYIPV